jgi:hypothetical protein
MEIKSVLKIIWFVLTVIIIIGMLGLAVLSLTMPHWGLFLVAVSIAAIFGLFFFFDVKAMIDKEDQDD